jgi:hypothetical protein
VKIFEHRGASRPDLERILVVGDRDTLLRGQHGRVTASRLVHFSAGAGRHLLIGVLRCFAVASNGRWGVFLRHLFLLILD